MIAYDHASLFSGIGGFDLAAEWAGWTNAFNCEIDPFCRKVLKYHFPNAEQYEDIRTTDFTVRKDGIYAVELVAYPDGNRRRKRTNEQKPLPECVGTSDAGNGVENGIVAYPDRQRCEECNASGQSGHTQGRTTQEGDAKRRIPDWNGFPTQPPVCGGDDGFPGELVGIAFPLWCREAVKACGNAIVPQVALQIFETINEYERK